MAIQELRLRSFRCHEHLVAQFSPHLNIIIGNNGQGITALLEAIYFVSQLRSFRTSTTRELVQYQHDQFFIQLKYDNNILKIK